MRAGDWMKMNDRPNAPVSELLEGTRCTANFGAFDSFKSPQTGESIKVMFVLGAGHCLEMGHEVMRRSSNGDKDWIGLVRREGNDGKPGTIDVDVAAVRLTDPGVVPRKIYTTENRPRLPVKGIAVAPIAGTEVCYSGITSDAERCGPIVDDPHEELEPEGGTGTTIMVCFEEYIRGGDSGSPVWLQGENGEAWAVGIANAGFDELEAAAWGAPPRTCFEPFLPYPGWGPRSGLFTHPMMAPLQLAKAP